MPNTLTGMGWVGGKSAGKGNNTGTGKWVNSLLPNDMTLYAEPFSGMLGVLLQREPAKYEIVNDLDERIVNWWRVVRDYPQELTRLVAFTVKSRKEFEWALETVDSPTESSLYKALAFTILVQQCPSGVFKHKTNWGTAKRAGIRNWRRGLDERLYALADRIKDVQFECTDAIKLLEKLAKYGDDTLIYCDPPYTDIGNLYRKTVDYAKLTEALQSQEGWVAISGYEDDWNHLGWKRHEYITHVTNTSKKIDSRTRIEVLWTNYD